MENQIKKFLKIALFVAFIPILSSCSEDDDMVEITVKLNQTAIEYDSEGVWTGVATNNPIQSQYMVFSHEGEDSPWGLIWRGFTPARSSDTNQYPNEWLDHQYNIMPGGGLDGKGTPYFVVFWNSQETDETPLDGRSCKIYYSKTIGGEKELFFPQSVYITNSCYGYYTMRDGDPYCRQFEQNDYFCVKFYGICADGTTTEPVIAYLADCRGEDKNDWFVDEWKVVDLRSLGEVTDIFLTMESSDTGQWGMNTPAYIGLDRLEIKATLPKK